MMMMIMLHSSNVTVRLTPHRLANFNSPASATHWPLNKLVPVYMLHVYNTLHIYVIHIMYIYKHVYIHIYMYSKEVLALMIDTWQKDWHSIWIAYYELQRRTWTNGFVHHYFYLLPNLTTNLICPPSSGAGVSSTFLSGFRLRHTCFFAYSREPVTWSQWLHLFALRICLWWYCVTMA